MLVQIWSVVWWLSLHELLLHPAPICPDAGPDHCTLCWWFFPSINRCKYSTGTCGGQHLLQLALVVFFLPAAGANTPLAHVVVISRCNLRWWCFFFQPLAQILYLHSCNLHCVVVVACGYIYIYIRHSQFVTPRLRTSHAGASCIIRIRAGRLRNIHGGFAQYLRPLCALFVDKGQ